MTHWNVSHSYFIHHNGRLKDKGDGKEVVVPPARGAKPQEDDRTTVSIIQNKQVPDSGEKNVTRRSCPPM